MAAVVFTILLSAGIVIRELDVSRVEARNLRDSERQIAANRDTITELRRTTRVLCERGNTLIDLVNTALILVSQRLAADLRSGNAVAARADRKFLKEFLKDREKLIREQTGDGPCAP